MKRGQVYYADFGKRTGSEQGGKRPCVIIQNDTGNKYSSTVIVAPMTSRNKNSLPTHVETTKEDKHLLIGSTILTEQIQTVDKNKIGDFICNLSSHTMHEVDEALQISLALDTEERKEEPGLNELQIFQSEEFGQVRMVDVDGKTYFVANDVAKALGYSNPSKATNDHCKNAIKEWGNDSLGRPAEFKVIPEGDVYRLIIKSQLPSADKFERWIFDEVIPSIRQTGGYQKKLSPQEIMRIQLGMIDDHENRIVNLENNMTLDYGQQRVLEDTVNVTVIDVLGGKKSNAYADMGRKVFAECNRDLKRYFNVNARNNVPKRRFDEAVDYAKNWKPCTNTMMMICNCNAQMNL